MCLNGTSLTVTRVDRRTRSFDVMLIAHTQQHVNLPMLDVGAKVNLEVDEVGKYVDRFVRAALMTEEGEGQEGTGILSGWLGKAVTRAVDARVEELLKSRMK